MRYITADFIFPITSVPIKNGVISIDSTGKILEIGPKNQFDNQSLEYHEGILIPGFINTHCHLELSHMQGLVNTGTGLIDFISNIVKYRDFEIQQIKDAIITQDQYMWNTGIMAVGDISNTDHTAETKQNSSIDYYTFVEMFDFMQSNMTANTIEQYTEVYNSHQSKKSYVPHAPYTVSKGLFDFIKRTNSINSTVSIHNQETPAEDQLFLQGDGDFIDFYKGFDMQLDELDVNGQSAINYAIKHMDPEQRTLFVHNTMTQKKDIESAHQWSKHVYWATCANANLYIENRLPDYRNFINTDAKLTIGTDSLSSNWQLSILEEIKTIQKYNSYIDFETLLKWSTLNGAEALGMQDKLGSLEIGKIPGILLLNVDFVGKDTKINSNTRVKRLI